MRISATQFRSRHCERSEAIQALLPPLDCFVALLLAMTMAIGAGVPRLRGDEQPTKPMQCDCNYRAALSALSASGEA
jgi:hypothetical protein